MIDETTKFNRAEGYYKRDASMGNVDGAWKNFVSMVQEPRNMYADGQLVKNTDNGSRPGYAGVKGQDRGAVQNLYDQFGKKVIDKLSKEKFGKNFDKVEGGRGANARNNFVARIKEKGTLSLRELQLAGRDLQVKNRLGIQLDILEDLKKGPVTVEALAKKYKVSQKVIKEKGTLLLKNIYNKNIQMGKGVERGGRWLPDDDVTIDKILNNISKSPKLAVIQKDQIGRLFYDAFGREKLSNGKKNPTYNSKKYTAILKNLNEYNKIKKIISDKYPNIKLELDHPLSKSTLRKVFNASVDELVSVNPLERSLNQGFKKSLSDSYEKAITGEGNIKQKKAIEKIAKDLNINIGNVSNDFSKYKTGAKSFEKLNIKDEILKSMQTQADLNSNLKGYVKQNPELFKTADVNPNTNITKVTQGQVQKISSLLKKIEDIDPKLAKKVSIQLNSGIPIDQMLEEIRKIPGIDKLGKGFMKVGGPFEVAFLGLDTINELSKGKDFDESFKTAVQNLTFGAYKGGDREKLETLSDAATELNLDSTGFAELRKTMELTEQIESAKKVKMGELASNDQSLTNMTDQEVEAYHDNKINRLQTEINNIGTSLKESGNFDTLVNNYTEVTKYVAGKQYDKGLEGNILTGNRRDRVFPGQGDIGSGISSTISDFRSLLPQNFLQNSITKVIPNTLRKLPFGVGSIFEPTSERAKLFDSSKEEKEKRLNKMEPSIKGQIEQNYYSEGGITGLRSKYEYKK